MLQEQLHLATLVHVVRRLDAGQGDPGIHGAGGDLHCETGPCAPTGNRNFSNAAEVLVE